MTAEPIDPTRGGNSPEVPLTDARARLPELVDDVRDGGIVYLTRYGRRLAAIVPADVAENYERMEDAYWSRRADEVLSSTRDDEWLPMEQVFAALDIADRRTGT